MLPQSDLDDNFTGMMMYRPNGGEDRLNLRPSNLDSTVLVVEDDDSTPTEIASMEYVTIPGDGEKDPLNGDHNIIGTTNPSQDSTATAPSIIVVVAPRSATFASDDPLFRGVCLYSGTMDSSQREVMQSKMMESTTRLTAMATQEGLNQPSRRFRWVIPSIFPKNSTRTAW